jgi:ABC-2 type transport system ATP-binding protein
MKDDVAVSVKNVYKDFKLPHEKVSSVKSAFTGVLRGKSSVRYEKQHALKDISFEIKKGEFFGIVGRNGSGKSTLLKIIAQIYQPTKGTVRVSGKLVPFIELGVGFNPELTGRENVYLNGAILGFTKEQIDKNYKEIVEFAELEEFMDQKLKNYSSGMQVRLAFACATKAEADILLVDEVLAVGDTDFQRKCFNFFKELKRQSKTVVFVTHDMNAVREYCDRALLIEKSETIMVGASIKVAGHYSRLFIKTEENESFRDAAEQERWGDKSVEILSPRIIRKEQSELTLEFTVKANQDVDDPMIGFYFVDSFDVQICGTNTALLNISPGPYKKGKKYKITFDMLNVLNDGEYYVTLAVLKDSGSVISDWWVNAVTLTIKKSQHVSYLVDIPVKFLSEGLK